MKKILINAFASYIATTVLTSGNVFYNTRERIKSKTPGLVKGNPGTHLVDCRLCTGAYISLVVVLVDEPKILCKPKTLLKRWFTSYGISYFLTTQER